MQLGGVGNSGYFGIVRTILSVPLNATSQRHHNQPATALVWAETAGGLCGGFVFRRVDAEQRNGAPHRAKQCRTPRRATLRLAVLNGMDCFILIARLAPTSAIAHFGWTIYEML